MTGDINSGAGEDSFDFTQGGVVGGMIIGGADDDSLIGNDDDRLWLITGLNAGNASGIGDFLDVEKLFGGAGVDTFTFSGGSLPTGLIDGGDNDDIINADNVMNTFTLSGENEGTATGVGAFFSIENLVGNDMEDRFELGTGSVTGSIDGGMGSDTLVAGDVTTTFTVTSDNAGFATGASAL